MLILLFHFVYFAFPNSIKFVLLTSWWPSFELICSFIIIRVLDLTGFFRISMCFHSFGFYFAISFFILLKPFDLILNYKLFFFNFPIHFIIFQYLILNYLFTFLSYIHCDSFPIQVMISFSCLILRVHYIFIKYNFRYLSLFHESFRSLIVKFFCLLLISSNHTIVSYIKSALN